MKRSIPVVAGLAVAASLLLTACGGGSDDSSDQPAASGSASADTKPVELTLSGWSLATTPEFQVLADAYHAKHPNVTVTLKEYDATKYNDLIVADLAANAAPDIITQKNVSYVTVFAPKLVDISDLVADLPEGINGVKSYEVAGKQYALPYRNDSWVLFYNKDLFDKAGVAVPDGTWTWDDYADTAKELTTKLGAAGSAALGTYQHSWQSIIQGFANAQTDADIFSGDYSYMKPFYERALGLQDAGAQVDQGTVTTSKLTYQAQFGKQQAAMMPMGSWFVATLIAQQASGDSDKFAWGFAPIPQADSKTTGTSKTPVTFGDPTGFGINGAIDKDKLQAAKDFVAFSASEEAANALAKIGITPALTSDAVAETYFATAGAPTDELSKFAWTTHKTLPENPTDKNTAAVQKILGDAHTAIMTGSSSVDDALQQATDRVKNEVGLG